MIIASAATIMSRMPAEASPPINFVKLVANLLAKCLGMLISIFSDDLL